MKRLTRLLAALSLLALLSMPGMDADAATATSSFTVTASVTANCTISTVGISFGDYDPVVVNAGTALDSNGSVTVACTNGAGTNIGMDQGSNAAGTSTPAVPERQMAGTATPMRYDLYQDSGYATVWGDAGTPAVLGYTSTGFAPSTFTIYGRIPAGQDVEVGAYTDTVTATITF